MSPIAYVFFFSHVVFIQNVCSQFLGSDQLSNFFESGYGIAPPGFLGSTGACGLTSALSPITTEISNFGLESAYGGAGVGEVAVVGELPVAGMTLVNGQVPILGAVRFAGDVPAAGTVTITGSCTCGCNI